MTAASGKRLSDDVDEFTVDVADQIESFLIALGAVARGDFPGGTLSILLLEVSQLLLAGGRLGAIVDVVPSERFEPDVGIDPDADGLRERLAELLGPADEYVEVFDPYVRDGEIVQLPAVRRHRRRRCRPLPRAGALQGGPCRRGAVVVAVLLPGELGLDGQLGAARPALGGRAHPARRADA